MMAVARGPGAVKPPARVRFAGRLRRAPRRILPLFAVPVAAALAMASCAPAAPDGGEPGGSEADTAGEAAAIPLPARQQETSMADTSVTAAQEALTPTVMALAGVVGTAVGLCDGSPCIHILVATADSVLLAQLPERFRGFPVEVRVVGEIRAQDTTGTSGG